MRQKQKNLLFLNLEPEERLKPVVTIQKERVVISPPRRLVVQEHERVDAVQGAGGKGGG